MRDYFNNIVVGIRSFWKGLSLTFKHMKNKEDLVATLQYPNEQWPIPERNIGYENSEYKSSKFEELLLVRYEENKPTLITTNAFLDSFSTPLVSRIGDKTLTTFIDFNNQKDRRLDHV